MPRWAITMPQVKSGVRRRLRLHKGARLAAATPGASARPSRGSTPDAGREQDEREQARRR